MTFNTVSNAASDRILNLLGATSVALELTTLEEIFLQMSKEEPNTESDDEDSDVASQPLPLEDIEDPILSLKRIWQNFGTVTNLSFVGKVFQVQKVCCHCLS